MSALIRTMAILLLLKGDCIYIFIFNWLYIKYKIYQFSKLFFFSGFFCGPYEKELIKDLLYDYERQNRPVLNESEPLVLTFGVSLTQIIDVVTMIENIFTIY